MTQAILTISYNVQKALKYRERITLGLMLIIMASATMYVYFVQKTVWNTMERGTLTKQIQNINLSMNDLEGTYLKLESGITSDTALSMGFIPAPAQNTSFITSKSLGNVAATINEI